MSTSKFTETQNLVAFLKKPTEYEGFEQIVDFLNANPIKYDVTVNPTIYTSYTQQFWDSTKVKTVNKDVHIRALVDGKKVIINEASIRRDLRMDDAEGTTCLPNAAIFEELARIGVLSLEQIKTNQEAKIKKLKKRVKKLEGKKKKITHGLKRLYKARDKGKGIMVEPEKPLKKKDQITFDEEVARKLDAQMKDEMEKEKRIAREKDEANRAYFAAKRDEEIKNKPPMKAQQKSQVTKGSSKRARDEIEQERAKRQRLEKEDDTAKLKRCLEIVPEDDDDVTIEATPLSSKSPTIVDYKIYKEGKKSYFKIIRVDGNSQNYLTFRTMLKNFNRKYLEVLRSIVKERFKKTMPVNDMFQHHVEDNIWKYQQGVVKVHSWKLYDSRRVYYVTTQNLVYYI
uniref:Xylulose kinase-1 n=1 Tax=Tanacetum cinerariifolium TaxID=118510 RepID=A0A6L2JTH3_TANCI|nr:hypothetical protein [Tanacetum cinerariifolium]